MTELLREYLATQRAAIPLWGFVLNLVLTALLTLVLGRVYVTLGTALSNRRAFARNFVLLGMTTMLIITVVKSSLALSLGLVGALSIVRFRAAIKEPEELAYLFLVIAIGLGLGADQRAITLLAFAIIVSGLWLRDLMRRPEEHRNLHLTVSSREPESASLDSVVGILAKHCPEISLKRYDEAEGALEASFAVEFESLDQLQSATSELRALHASLAVRFVDPGGIGS